MIALLGCVPFGESKNLFSIRHLPDFTVERNEKSEIGFVTLVNACNMLKLLESIRHDKACRLTKFLLAFLEAITSIKDRTLKMTAFQEMMRFLLFDKLCDYTLQNFVVGSSNSDDGT